MEKKIRIIFDTSVLVAAVVEPHPLHSRALPWLTRAKAGEFGFLVASHTLAELYAVLTTLPTSPRISPGTAWRLVYENVEGFAKVVSLSSSDYRSTIKQMAELGLAGGAVYDALIARAAQKSGIDCLLTFNLDDFKRVWPSGESLLTIP